MLAIKYLSINHSSKISLNPCLSMIKLWHAFVQSCLVVVCSNSALVVKIGRVFLARAAAGELGDGVVQDYGLFPRGVLGAVDTVGKLRQEGIAAVLTASAVELSIMGNEDARAVG